MHAVQTRFKFGFHRRRRVLFAWLITFPKCGALPQNSHFSAIFLPASVFIWAWISCSKCRKTKLLILADPPPPAKRGVASRIVLRDTLHYRLASPPPVRLLFFRTGFERVPRTSNSSKRIEATGFASQKERPWPPVPLLTSFPPPNLPRSVRR